MNSKAYFTKDVQNLSIYKDKENDEPVGWVERHGKVFLPIGRVKATRSSRPKIRLNRASFTAGVVHLTRRRVY